MIAERGSDVVVTYRSRAAEAEELVKEIRAMGRKATALACDLTQRAAVDAVRQWRYTPTLLNGRPVQVVMTVNVAFRLE